MTVLALAACVRGREADTRVAVEVLGPTGKRLPSAELTSADARGHIVARGEVSGGTFHPAPGLPPPPGDWGRHVRSVEATAAGHHPVRTAVEVESERLRVAVGGHPSFRSKWVEHFAVSARLLVVPALDADAEAFHRLALDAPDSGDRAAAAVALGGFQPAPGVEQEPRDVAGARRRPRGS